MSEVDYAAGLFEGEGTVGAYQSNRLRYRKDGSLVTPELRISAAIIMTDPEPLHKFQKAVRLGRVTGPHVYRKNRPREKPTWIWQVATATEVWKLRDLLWSHLSQRRRAQFQAAWEMAGESDHYAGDAE